MSGRHPLQQEAHLEHMPVAAHLRHASGHLSIGLAIDLATDRHDRRASLSGARRRQRGTERRKTQKGNKSSSAKRNHDLIPRAGIRARLLTASQSGNKTAGSFLADTIRMARKRSIVLGNEAPTSAPCPPPRSPGVSSSFPRRPDRAGARFEPYARPPQPGARRDRQTAR